MTDYKANTFSVKKTLLISVLIILAGVIFTWVIFNTEPTAQREGATKKTPMLVEVLPIEFGDFTPIIEAMGTVIPSRSIQLQARVSGQVISDADLLIPGKSVQQGDLLLQIDAADYQNAVQQRQAEYNQAKADLQIEMGEQMAAERDYQRLGRDVTATQKALILREPQLASAKAQLAAAQSALDQAKLELQRTQIYAPFAAQIQNNYVNLGSQINVGDTLADLVGIDSYWIEATLPVNQLASLDQVGEGVGTSVTIQDRLAWPLPARREGNLLSVIGRVDDETRMARVLIAVNDPIGAQDSSLPKLTLGAFVNTQIPARELKDVARVARQYLRKNDTLWLMVDQQLRIINLNVIFRDEKYVYVRDSLKAGEQMVTTDLSRVIEGAALRLNSEESDAR